jgi:hypothetical protein
MPVHRLRLRRLAHWRFACATASATGMLAAAVIFAGCSAPQPRTTFLNSVDLVEMTDRMAQSFAADPEIEASASSEAPMVISIHRVVNQTNQIIPDREKWLYVARLRAMLSQSSLTRDLRTIWVIPPQQWARLIDELGPEPPDLRTPPTHELTATFYALTNTVGISGGGPGGRSDAYFCSYELVDLHSGRIVWEDKWEVKRARTGLTYD